MVFLYNNFHKFSFRLSSLSDIETRLRIRFFWTPIKYTTLLTDTKLLARPPSCHRSASLSGRLVLILSCDTWLTSCVLMEMLWLSDATCLCPCSRHVPLVAHRVACHCTVHRSRVGVWVISVLGLRGGVRASLAVDVGAACCPGEWTPCEPLPLPLLVMKPL